MKKSIILIVAVIATIVMGETVKAQNSGWWIGGSLGYWHDKTGDVKTNSFIITPEVGYDMDSKWTFAGIVGFNTKSVKVGDSKSHSNNAFVIEPYARYKYFNQGIMTLFVDGKIGVAIGDNDGFEVGLAPGLALKATERFGFVAHVGFLEIGRASCRERVLRLV